MEQQLFDAIKPEFISDATETLERIETIRTLLSQGANINALDPNGKTLVHVAILKRNQEILKFLIKSGADVNKKSTKGQPPLYIAFNFRNHKTKCTFVKLLIEAGATVNDWTFKDRWRNGRSPLHEAATTGDADLVQFLITAGAEVNAINVDNYSEFNWTALHYAARYVTTEDPAIFEVLLQANADIHARDSLGGTPLHSLSGAKLKKLSLARIVETFKKYNANFDAVEENRSKPIDVAVNLQNTQAVRALVLQGGVDVNSIFYSTKTSYHTILHNACYKFDLPTVKFLLKNGANINALDGNNVSPVHDVIDLIYTIDKRGDDTTKEMKLLRYLLKYNPDLNTITTDGKNILVVHNNKTSLLPDYLYQIILRQLAKMRAANVLLNHNLLETIVKHPVYHRYFRECNLEMERIKNRQLHEDSYITYYNLLIDNKKKLMHYAGNSNLVTEFQKIVDEEDYPIYGPGITERFSKAISKRLIWDGAARVLSRVLDVNIDDPAVIKILSLLRTEDMQKLQ